MQYSVTIAGLLVLALNWIGLTDLITPAEAETFVNLIVQLVGMIVIFVGRFRKGDITPLGFKK